MPEKQYAEVKLGLQFLASKKLRILPEFSTAWEFALQDGRPEKDKSIT
jgi:hypothetical protein